MAAAFLISFAVIFVAELGDKSQLMALAFATRYPVITVLAGITAATAVVHAVSVAFGAALGAVIPATAVSALAGGAFLVFGAWTLRGDRLSDEERRRAARPARYAVLSVGGVFFLAELGDKTMLATVMLATEHGAFGTWLGSTVGMVAADALAIGVGRVLGTRLPERTIRIGAAAAFFAFGGLLLVDAFR
jgi:Ca2+/H+ antiporter, TMEM165/GDT1 family